MARLACTSATMEQLQPSGPTAMVSTCSTRQDVTSRHERVEPLGHGSSAHRLLVNVKDAGEVVAENVLADTQPRTHREQNAMGQPALHQLHALPHGVPAPEAHHL